MASPRRLLHRTAATAALTATLLATSMAGLWAAVPAEAATAPYGPDVSSWQHLNGAPIDWAKVRAGGSAFAIVKATEGGSYVNPYYAADVRSARAARLVVGGYAFVRPALPLTTAAAQAKQLVTTLGSVATSGTLPPILDLEETGGLAPRDLITWTQSFLETVRAQSGRTPIVYSYPYFWSSAMAGTTALGRYPLWLASYRSTTPPPLAGWASWSLWQYTSGGTIPGIAGAVDVSRFNGTLTQLAALANGTTPSAWTVRAPAAPVGVTAAPGLQAATVTWRPSDDGGQLPSRYTVTASPGGATVTVGGTVTQARFTGLTPGTGYQFTVRATNGAGSSPWSAASAPVVPGQVPSTPQGLAATTAPGTVTLTWRASTGTPASYLVRRCSPAPCAPTAAVATVAAAGTTTFRDTGVTNGTRYACAVQASNRWGTSPSSAVADATPTGPPAAPVSVTATDGPAGVTVTWLPPVGDGGAAITQYVVSVDGTEVAQVAGTARSSLVTGLSTGTHSFAVQATNALGTGPATRVTHTTVSVSRALPASSLSATLPRLAPLSGQSVTVSITARRGDTGAPLVGQAVVVSFTPRTGTAAAPVRALTNASGVATASFRAVVAGTVKAVLPQSAAAAAASTSVLMQVRPSLSAALSATTTAVRHSVALVGSTSPLLAGERVYRQGYYDGAWHTWASTVIDRYGHYRFVVTPTVAATNYYRLWVSASWLHTAGPSRTLTLSVRP
ncbi:MAG: GH25 family lysozyme [Mycobacteriales bacterium]